MPARRFSLPLMLLGCLFMGTCANAADVFVDNLLGEDTFSGGSSVRSIQAALRRAGGNDVIHLADHGIPYFESIDISGRKFANGGQGGLTIDGHGAVVSGVFRIPSNAWESLGAGLWKIRPMRKAHYQLVNFDRAAPEVIVAPTASELPKLAPGHWAAWKGVIYYQAADQSWSAPDQLPLGLAAKDVGISIFDVNNVVIRNLTVRHFRLDGVNVHDRARGVVLENVLLVENGRSGLAVCGASQVEVVGSELAGNRVAQLWLGEMGKAQLSETKLLPGKAGLPIRFAGGKLLIDGAQTFEPRR
ncbi:MAG: right-handed parallel beta-helix repeat-containing protein [Planctomycetota bacterium]|nr:right-handed parallel beta-helix repeat-containing protein [Planctomycetota bacterium]